MLLLHICCDSWLSRHIDKCTVACLQILLSSLCRLWKDKCKDFDQDELNALMKSPAKRKSLVPIVSNPWKQASNLIFHCSLFFTTPTHGFVCPCASHICMKQCTNYIFLVVKSGLCSCVMFAILMAIYIFLLHILMLCAQHILNTASLQLYLRKHRIAYNWRHADMTEPNRTRTLKGHEDHVVRCYHSY